MKFLHGSIGFLGVLFNFCGFVGYEGYVVLAVLWIVIFGLDFNLFFNLLYYNTMQNVYKGFWGSSSYGKLPTTI